MVKPPKRSMEQEGILKKPDEEHSIDSNEGSALVTDTEIMNLNLKNNILIAFINRNGVITIPSGQDSIHVGDTVMIVTTHTGFNDIQDILKD